MEGQLTLFPDHQITGAECEFFGGIVDDHVRCLKSKSPTFVMCHKSHFGEPPRCVFSPIDNSEAAMKRRREWMKRNASND